MILCDTWGYLVMPGDTWPLMIPNNTYKFQIVADNTLQTWYQLVSLGIKNTSSINCQYDNSVAVVLSQHDTDGFVSVWYCHGTDSGDFQKPLMFS